MEKGKGRTLGSILTESEIITPNDIEKALAEQRRSGVRFGEALINLEIVTKEDVNWGLSNQFNIPFIRIRTNLIDPEAVRLVPEDIARQYHLVPYLLIDEELTVVVEDPTDKRAVATLEAITGKHLTVGIGLAEDIENALDEIYGSPQPGAAAHEDLVTDLFSEECLETIKADYTGNEFLRCLLVEAEKLSATSVHFEAKREGVNVRLRVMGQIRSAAQLSRAWARGILQRIKTDLTYSERRPGLLEGYYYRADNEHQTIYHASFAESQHGESATLINITTRTFPESLSQIKTDPDTLADLQTLLAHRHGLLVVAGPDGADRYQLLKLILREMQADLRETVLVGRLPWFADTDYIHLRPQSSRWEDILDALEVGLSQEPDLLLVEDLTQKRLFNAALRAALGSVYLFSKLGFSTTTSAMEFMLEIAESRSLLTMATRGLVTCACVRKLCPHCKVKDKRLPLAGRTLGVKKDQLNDIAGIKENGCEQCHNTGYAESQILLEVLPFTEQLTVLLKSTAGIDQIKPKLNELIKTTIIDQAKKLVLTGEVGLDDFISLMGIHGDGTD